MSPIEWYGVIGVIALVLGFLAYVLKSGVDKARLDALQTYRWQVGCVGGEFGVLAGSPPKMVGGLHADVRKAIDAALIAKEQNRG